MFVVERVRAMYCLIQVVMNMWRLRSSTPMARWWQGPEILTHVQRNAITQSATRAREVPFGLAACDGTVVSAFSCGKLWKAGYRVCEDHAGQPCLRRGAKFVLLAGSRVEDLRRTLKKLGAPTYGTMQQLWERLMENEARVAERAREGVLELEQAGEPRPGRILAGPESPSKLQRAQPELTHIPSKR
eukprot:1166070-Amphidinium_carterae.1